MKRFLVLAVLACFCLFAQTPAPSRRPSPSAMSRFTVKQDRVLGLTSGGYIYNPAINEPAGGDVYMGDDAGHGWVIAVGSSNVTLVLQDSTGLQIGQSWPFTAATTYPLTGMNGTWLKGGFKLSCTDSNSGAGCAATNAMLVWLE